MNPNVTPSAGVFGPAERLIFAANSCTPEEISSLTDMLKNTFQSLTNLKVEGEKEFQNWIFTQIATEKSISPSDIVNTRFFQNLQAQVPAQNDLHAIVLNNFVPSLRKLAQTTSSHTPGTAEEEKVVNLWCARFLESYMTREQIIKQAEQTQSQPKEIMDERQRIGSDIFAAVQAKQFSERDLDCVLLQLRGLPVTVPADHPETVDSIVKAYLGLFAKTTATPEAFKNSVIDGLDQIFRPKIFPKKSERMERLA